MACVNIMEAKLKVGQLAGYPWASLYDRQVERKSFIEMCSFAPIGFASQSDLRPDLSKTL